jgi:group I intron endonuclease
MSNSYCIYKITFPNNKIYIGQTKDLSDRMKRYGNRWCKQQPYLYYALCKYNFDTCLVNILHYDLTKAQANLKETEEIIKYNSADRSRGYNLMIGQPNGEFEHSEETKRKISEAKKGKPNPNSSTKFKKGQASHNKGKKVSRQLAAQRGKAHRNRIYTVEYYDGKIDTTDCLSEYALNRGWAKLVLYKVYQRKGGSSKHLIKSVTSTDKIS